MANRDRLIKTFMSKRKADPGDPFGKIGNLSPGQRIKRGRRKITEDDPRWNPKTMGNRRGREKGFTRQY
jgi:hypothetical protein